jgi:hypothetical protein
MVNLPCAAMGRDPTHMLEAQSVCRPAAMDAGCQSPLFYFANPHRFYKVHPIR